MNCHDFLIFNLLLMIAKKLLHSLSNRFINNEIYIQIAEALSYHDQKCVWCFYKSSPISSLTVLPFKNQLTQLREHAQVEQNASLGSVSVLLLGHDRLHARLRISQQRLVNLLQTVHTNRLD